MRRGHLALLACLACSDAGWEVFDTDRATLECRFQEACAGSSEGLDCDAYAAQYEARPDPCARYDAFYASSCIDQLDALVREVEADPSSCPADTTVDAPACAQAWVEADGGPCRSVD